MSEWFCNIAGQEIGPLTSHQLKAMADCGQIAPCDSVRRGDSGNWVSASHVQGLFSPKPAAPPVEPPPVETLPAPPPVLVPPPPTASPDAPPSFFGSIAPPQVAPDAAPSFFGSLPPLSASTDTPTSPTEPPSFFGSAPPPQVSSDAPPSFFGAVSPPPVDFFASAEPSVSWSTEPSPGVGEATPYSPSAYVNEPSEEAFEEDEDVEEEVGEEEDVVEDASEDDGSEEEESELPFGMLDGEVNIAAGRRLKGAVDARAKRKRQQQMLLVGSLIFVAVGSVAAVVLLSLGNTSVDKKDSPSEVASAEKVVAAPEAVSPAPTKKKEPANPVEAAGLRMVVGNVPVRIIGFARGNEVSPKPSKDTKSKKADVSKTPENLCLLITVEVRNPSNRDKLNFVAWSADAKQRGALLTDGHGKPFAGKRVDVSSVLGRPVPSTVPPGEAVRDVLGFEMPEGFVESFELELPGEAFGMNGPANFTIPMNLLAAKSVAVRMAPPPKEPGKETKKRHKPKPGTPEYDFGIEED